MLAELWVCDKAAAMLTKFWRAGAESLKLPMDEVLDQALQGAHPVGVALTHGQFEVLRQMSREGKLAPGDLEHADARGHTPLHRAAASGRAEAIRCIMELTNLRRDMVVAKDIDDRNLFHHAAISGGGAQCIKEVTTVVSTHGYEHDCAEMLDHLDRWKWSPLHLAIDQEDPKCVIALIEAGATIRLPMGSQRMTDEAIALVPLPTPSEVDGRSWVIARCSLPVAGEVVFTTKAGEKFVNIDTDNCVFGPTPLDLAKRIGTFEAELLQRLRPEAS